MEQSKILFGSLRGSHTRSLQFPELLPVCPRTPSAEQSHGARCSIAAGNDITAKTDTCYISFFFFSPTLLSLGSAVDQIEHDYVLNLNRD